MSIRSRVLGCKQRNLTLTNLDESWNLVEGHGVTPN